MSLPQPNDIDVICVSCGARLRIRRGKAGKVYKCPKCSEALSVEKPWDEAVAELLAGTPPQVEEPAPIVAREQAESLSENRSQRGGQSPFVPETPQKGTVPDGSQPQAAVEPHSQHSDNEYNVLPGIDQPPAGSTAYAKYFPVLCPTCHTRLYATEEQVGQMIDCPDCRRSVKVPPPPPPKPKPKRWTEGDGVPVAIGAACDRDGAFDAVKSQIRLQANELPGREETPLPSRPLVKGVFSFPGYFAVWPRWIAFSIWLALVLVLVRFAVNFLANAMGNGIAGAGLAIGAVLCIMMSSITGGSLWLAISGLLLGVLEDTSDGLDKIENWPESMFSNLRASYFTLNAVVMSALPGVAVSSIFISGGEPRGWVATPASVLLLFPIVLLSMLAQNSPMIPIDRMVWRSLKTSRASWIFFYIESLVVLGLAGAAGFVAWQRDGIWILAAAAVVIVAALLIYFRLLGRLGWISAMQDVEEEENDEAGKERTGAHPAVH